MGVYVCLYVSIYVCIYVCVYVCVCVCVGSHTTSVLSSSCVYESRLMKA